MNKKNKINKDSYIVQISRYNLVGKFMRMVCGTKCRRRITVV